jgi:thioredoxin 1
MDREPTREEVDGLRGPVVLEFGATWCGHCIALAPHVKTQLTRFPQFSHLKIEDGRGKPLGRSFRVKLWPTLVFLHDGVVVAQLVRPSADALGKGFDELAAAAGVAPA